jgi:KaiC/GvpD/RAD55 family RecA-like ATPase
VEKPIENSITKKGSFDYIVGSFSVEENAKSVITTLRSKGMNARQLVEKGLFKVSAGTAVSATEINLIAEKSKSNGFTGWILKR